MVMPNGEQSQHLCRKRAMDAQVWSHKAVPVFHGTAGANGQIPRLQQFSTQSALSWRKSLQQFLRLLTQDLSPLPSPLGRFFNHQGQVRGHKSPFIIADIAGVGFSLHTPECTKSFNSMGGGAHHHIWFSIHLPSFVKSS